jgi:hypothetical protein
VPGNRARGVLIVLKSLAERFGLGSRVVGDGLRNFQGGVFPTHVISPHFAFGDDAGDGLFQTLGTLSFFLANRALASSSGAWQSG